MNKLISQLLISVVLVVAAAAQTPKSADIVISNARIEGGYFLWEIHITPTNDWGSSFGAALGDCSWFFEYNSNGLSMPELVYQAPEIDSVVGYENTVSVLGGYVSLTTDLNFPVYLGFPLNQGTTYHLFTIRMTINFPQSNSGLFWDQLNTGLFNALDEPITVSFLGHGNISLQGSTGIETSDNIMAERFTLYPNYPNPFNPETTIQFMVPTRMNEDLDLELIIFNSLGDIVRKLYSGTIAPGTYKKRWDGRNQQGYPVASGTYFARLQIGSIQQCQKLILLR